MYGAVDLLAHEYSWSKDDILYNVYPDELFYISQQIRSRKATDYRMRLQMIHNPYVKNPKELFNLIDQLDTKPKKASLDRAGFAFLKQELAKNPKFIVK